MKKAKVQSGELFAILQEAVVTELTVSLHYWGRAAFWRSRGVPKLAAAYTKEATEEQGHGQLLLDRMLFLGKMPELRTGKVSLTEGAISAQLEEDLTGEIEVANKYATWVQTALEQKDFVTMDILKQILRDTEEHVDWLQSQLDIALRVGDQNYLQSWVSVAG